MTEQRVEGSGCPGSCLCPYSTDHLFREDTAPVWEDPGEGVKTRKEGDDEAIPEV